MKNQQRIEEILLSLKKCDYLSREQLQKMHNLGQTRNAQRLLSSMEEYISHFTEDRKKIYYLNAIGREVVQSEKVRKKTAMIHHYLMRNDLYIHMNRPSSWKNEIKISIPDTKLSIVADSAFISNKIHHFVEVDYQQSMKKNVDKINRYKKLSTINSQFALIWVTKTPYRKKKLESLCTGLKGKVYLWEDIK
ncbi:replication-relaxation family protein [Peribacillus loiseleuriae]|uniref:replication-relaxation family protein n=1 Tax=Peribacillus loiseleuriae TaxID=1679170 RepID=UPI0015D58679|nr:replication-relaxation family protein [Peribacillus loiseleuriae]